MKIVFLNVWEGKLQEAVIQFIREQSADTDIFCFQEFSGAMDHMPEDILSGYDKISAHKVIDEKDYFLQATFVRKNLHVLSSGVLLEHQMGGGLAVYVRLRFGNNDLYVCNLHGTSKPGEKSDTPVRVKQSRGLIEYFKKQGCVIVVGGDFNLFPDTKSVRMFEENGYKNLVRDFEIKTTRNHYAWDEYDTPYYFSDYVFVSPRSLSIKGFSVPDIEVSDHLPLILDIEPITN